MAEQHTMLDETTGKKISMKILDRLEPFIKNGKDIEALTKMNRKERRKFYSLNKKRVRES